MAQSLSWLVIFGFLLLQCVLLLTYCLPLPHVIRKYAIRAVDYIWDGSFVLRTTVVVLFMFNVFLFVDSMRSKDEYEEAKAQIHDSMSCTAHILKLKLARSQRNATYNFFNIFLSIVLWRIHQMQKYTLSLESQNRQKAENHPHEE